ncbi:MAG: short chain dehydrogenase family protein [Gammaproteobacteria bacterium]|nr:short chain dehydrogenase family protein [Gammaproteobacteria bacterium]
MSSMQGRVVIVTGGFGALGSAVARKCSAAGATVAMLGRAPPSATLAAEFTGPHVLLSGVDLARLDDASKAIATVTARTARIDALINVAGGFRSETLEHGDVATWDLMFHMNLKTAVVASKAVLPYLLASGRGRIVNVGAGAAARAGAGMGAYTASKAGVERLTESLAAELGAHDITVNSILPGVIDTPQNRADMPDADVKRWVQPDAIADVVLFLVSDEARAVNGASVRVFGRG